MHSLDFSFDDIVSLTENVYSTEAVIPRKQKVNLIYSLKRNSVCVRVSILTPPKLPCYKHQIWHD